MLAAERMAAGQWEFTLTGNGESRIMKQCMTPDQANEMNGDTKTARAFAEKRTNGRCTIKSYDIQGNTVNTPSSVATEPLKTPPRSWAIHRKEPKRLQRPTGKPIPERSRLADWAPVRRMRLGRVLHECATRTRLSSAVAGLCNSEQRLPTEPPHNTRAESYNSPPVCPMCRSDNVAIPLTRVAWWCGSCAVSMRTRLGARSEHATTSR